MSKELVAKALGSNFDGNQWGNYLLTGSITYDEFEMYIGNKLMATSLYIKLLDAKKIPLNLYRKYLETNILELNNVFYDPEYYQAQKVLCKYLIKKTDLGYSYEDVKYLKHWVRRDDILMDIYSTLNVAKDDRRLKVGLRLGLINWGKVSALKSLNEDFCIQNVNNLDWRIVLSTNTKISDDFIIKNQDIIAKATGKIDFNTLYRPPFKNKRRYDWKVVKKLDHLFILNKISPDLKCCYTWDFFKHFEATKLRSIDLPYGLTKDDDLILQKVAQELVALKHYGYVVDSTKVNEDVNVKAEDFLQNVLKEVDPNRIKIN